MTKRTESTDSQAPVSKVKEWIKSLAIAILIFLVLRTFLIEAFRIPSGSMENTLLIGDHVFVDRDTMGPPTRWIGPLIPYHTIHRHDIVVFLSPAEPGLYVVKRIIGIPGDRIHLRDGVVYVNGQPQQEPYVIHNGSYNAYRDNFPTVLPDESSSVTPQWQFALRNYIQGDDLVVPPDRYFAMGDNRDVSYDSRYWGFIPRENIIGRPMFIYWSFETPPGQYLKTSLGDRLAFMAKMIFHFVDQTRWSRMLRMVR